MLLILMDKFDIVHNDNSVMSLVSFKCSAYRSQASMAHHHRPCNAGSTLSQQYLFCCSGHQATHQADAQNIDLCAKHGHQAGLKCSHVFGERRSSLSDSLEMELRHRFPCGPHGKLRLPTVALLLPLNDWSVLQLLPCLARCCNCHLTLI